MGLAAAWLVPNHTAAAERLTGTVTWSNEENRRIVFDVAGRTRDRAEYSVLAESWIDATGRSHNRGYPSCLAGRSGDPVRTDRRRIEAGVIYLDVDGEPSSQIVVSVRCFD